MIAFSIVFPLTPHFRLFSVFQRVLRLYWEVIVFRLPVFLEFTTFYRHENAPQLCIKIGVRIWLKTLILIQCTLWLNRGCIFVWAKSYRFRLKIGEGAIVVCKPLNTIKGYRPLPDKIDTKKDTKVEWIAGLLRYAHATFCRFNCRAYSIGDNQPMEEWGRTGL